MADDYKQLTVWQKSMDLVTLVYRATSGFPPDERFGLTNQMRRAAVSIPSNIAEGQARGSKDDFKRFCRIANGSRQELETQTLCAYRLGFLSETSLNGILDIIADIGRLLSGLIRSLRPAD